MPQRGLQTSETVRRTPDPQLLLAGSEGVGGPEFLCPEFVCRCGRFVHTHRHCAPVSSWVYLSRDGLPAARKTLTPSSNVDAKVQCLAARQALAAPIRSTVADRRLSDGPDLSRYHPSPLTVLLILAQFSRSSRAPDPGNGRAADAVYARTRKASGPLATRRRGLPKHEEGECRRPDGRRRTYVN